MENKKIRIFKLDRGTKIMNYIYSYDFSSQINVVSPNPNQYRFQQHVALLPDGSTNYEVSFNSLVDSGYTFSDYTEDARHALVNDQLHIFGGKLDHYSVN